MVKSILTVKVQALFYLVAGLNHFANPGFYLPLIPKYLPVPELINLSSGIIEMVLGAGLLWSHTRKYSGISIILMLIAFIPSHIYFIQIGSCVDGGLCLPSWIAWGRLVIIHPLFIYWAFQAARFK